MDILWGVWGFVEVTALAFVVTELTSLVVELVDSRSELRRGFLSVKSSPFRVLKRHLIIILRSEGKATQHWATSAKFLVLALALGLLPCWHGQVPLDLPHSLWLYILLVVLGPVGQFVLEWSWGNGVSWPTTLLSAERVIGGMTVHFILGTTLVAITGLDQLSALRDFQRTHGWIIFHYPLTILLVFAYGVMNLFTSFETIFSTSPEERGVGWAPDQALPRLRQTMGTLFIVDVFLGGAEPWGVVGDFSLVMKAVIVNFISHVLSKQFFSFREDQSEALILWRLAPLSILVLAVALLFPGGWPW